jgi:hypothetical protein
VSRRAPAAAALSSRRIGRRGGDARRRSFNVRDGIASGGTGRARRSGRRWCCSWCWRSWCCWAPWPSLWWCCCCSPTRRTWRCGRRACTRWRRPVDAPGVPAPLLLAQRHRAPLQMQLQVQVLVLLTAVPSVLSSGYSSDLSSMAGRERDGSRFRNSKWLHRFLSCLGFVQLLIHPHVACIGRQKKILSWVLSYCILRFH